MVKGMGETGTCELQLHLQVSIYLQNNFQHHWQLFGRIFFQVVVLFCDQKCNALACMLENPGISLDINSDQGVPLWGNTASFLPSLVILVCFCFSRSRDQFCVEDEAERERERENTDFLTWHSLSELHLCLNWTSWQRNCRMWKFLLSIRKDGAQEWQKGSARMMD